MDGLSFPGVTSTPEVPTSATRDDPSEQLIVSLVQLACKLYGQVDEVGEQFCYEVTTRSRGCVRLLLRDQPTERAALATLPATRLKLPVEHNGIAYGELFVACDPHQPPQPALSYESSARLAQLCGELLHMLEEGTLLSYLNRRVDLPSAEVALSPRQLEVLRHMAMGEDTEAIARALRITVATVEAHRWAIYARLGVHGPLEAVVAGHRLGLFLLIGSSSLSAIPSQQ